MTAARAITVLYLFIVLADCKSIGDSENVTKRDSKEDLFPDWVPFKNKHGDELGDFIQVEPKKPKKRLALPVNYVLRAFADPDPEDYFEKGQGEGDSEDYYEKRDWADLNRPDQHPAKIPANANLNHSAISDIDGVVGIITRHQPNVLKPSSKIVNPEPPREENVYQDNIKEERDEAEKKAEFKTRTNKKKGKSEDEYSDYEEENTEKPKPTEEEQREAEARKAKILSSVDELKERHAMEQKSISEKVKEEAMHKEERERDIDYSAENDKYSHRRHKHPIYDDYDEKFAGSEDKYKIITVRPSTTTRPRTRWSTKTKKNYNNEKKSRVKQYPEVTGKMSVFRNPSIYMIYDEESSSTEPSTSSWGTESTSYTKASSTTPDRFSSKYSTTAKEHSNESERISLVPEDAELKEGEPTLFFPKRRKNSRKRKNSTTTSKPDLHLPDVTTKEPVLIEVPLEINNATGFSSFEYPSSLSTGSSSEVSGPTLTGSILVGASGPTMTSGSSSIVPTRNVVTTGLSGPSNSNDSITSAASVTTAVEADTTAVASDTAPSASGTTASGSDAAVASSDHKAHEKEGNHEHEKGGESEHHSEHHSSEGSSEKKAYEGQHKDSKTEEGHHDKEDHLGSYHDHGGHDEKHHDEKKHYGHHHHEEHGKKHAEYEESGKHSKGHSTKGSHDIHKKEEYEKKVEFFEEEGDSTEEAKHGGHSERKGHQTGGKFEKSHGNDGFHGRAKGDSGHFHKGGHAHVHKAYKSAAGNNNHGQQGGLKQNNGHHENGKKWIYHHGFPAKNANLVVIDRRTDQLYHGPQYYG